MEVKERRETGNKKRTKERNTLNEKNLEKEIRNR
jgi:hypothetical protein